MKLKEYIDSEITEDNIHDYAISSDESVVKQVIDAISDKIKVDTTYNDITFGQLVLIENYMKIEAPYERIISVLSTFYRPIEESVFDNTNEAVESANRALFEGVIFGVALELFDRVMKDRENFFYRRFAGVVYDSNKGQGNGGDETEMVESLEKKFVKAFGWYERQRNISKEMNISFQAVLDLKAIDCMVELAYQAMKYKVESKRNNIK